MPCLISTGPGEVSAVGEGAGADPFAPRATRFEGDEGGAPGSEDCSWWVVGSLATAGPSIRGSLRPADGLEGEMFGASDSSLVMCPCWWEAASKGLPDLMSCTISSASLEMSPSGRNGLSRPLSELRTKTID